MGQLCQWHRDTTPLNLGLTDCIHREYYPHCISRQQFMETRPCGAAKQLKRTGKGMRVKMLLSELHNAGKEWGNAWSLAQLTPDSEVLCFRQSCRCLKNTP